MITTKDIKQWLRIDHNEDDELLETIINSSTAIIHSATGISKEYIQSNKSERLKLLYDMVQRILVTDLYNERDEENKALLSYYIQLEVAYQRELIKETTINETQ